jgi:hypothetical protein
MMCASFTVVGGDILDYFLTRLNKNAHIVLCGAISQYNAAKPKGLQNYTALISMRARMEGFIVYGFLSLLPSGLSRDTESWFDSTK